MVTLIANAGSFGEHQESATPVSTWDVGSRGLEASLQGGEAIPPVSAGDLALPIVLAPIGESDQDHVQ